MGLGLSFVSVILQHHQAVLEIESRPMAGTTFRARFAISEAMAPVQRA
jgi:signal transduction histidine kinase